MKKSAGTARRLSRSLAVDNDNEDMNAIDRLTNSSEMAEESHLDRLKNRRWSISLPKSFGEDNECAEGDENEESLNLKAERKAKSTKRQAKKVKEEDHNCVSGEVFKSPEKKRLNNQTTPDLIVTKAKSRKPSKKRVDLAAEV